MRSSSASAAHKGSRSCPRRCAAAPTLTLTLTTDPDPNPDQIDDRVERSDEAAYDNTARILGRGTASVGGAYILPYLQSGHMLLLGVLLLASTISYPGDRVPA